MPEIKLEYPSGQRSTEMLLVKMLSEKRSWNDYMEISNALFNIRLHAKSMQDEQKHIAGNARENTENKD